MTKTTLADKALDKALELKRNYSERNVNGKLKDSTYTVNLLFSWFVTTDQQRNILAN